ncbi:MAG: AmmeMemoRadiSam system radical SAM enzyme [Candidatus Altiarchaeota archaeon]|nr:AmmeMemoRadiSam system radical SAM enzyme [Candidatus Altiarchaeota archaeon]
MHEALFYKTDGRVLRCGLCPHRCVIPDGRRGLCGVRENRGGILYSLVYGRPCAMHVDPIEKKPLYHFLPGSRSYSISTVGCNLSCMHCQNWEISQANESEKIAGRHMTPENVVSEAVESGCSSISYTYTEPTVFLEYALDISKLAKQDGLKNVFVSNGYMNEEPRNAIVPYLDADNIDLKCFSDKTYRKYCGGRLQPVLDTLKSMVNAGVWVEVTTLIIPEVNDSVDELDEIASYIKKELGDFVPWHVSAFHPDYKLSDLPSTKKESVEDAVKIGLDAGLKYVYPGNIGLSDFEDTICSKCNKVLIKRRGYTILANYIVDSSCPDCNTKIEGVWS